MHRLKLASASIAVLLVLGGATLFFSSSSVADDRGGERRHKDTDVTWSPSVLHFSLKPGETQSLPVTFTAREKIDEDTLIYASTSLKDIVSVTPTKIGRLRKGQTGTITVVVKLPILQGAGTTTGFVQLYDTDKRWGRKPERAGMPLAISIAPVCPCLPPDPGEAGKATIAGIDSDNDGVRDDVQRLLAVRWPQYVAEGRLIGREVQHTITGYGTPLTRTEEESAFCTLAQGRIAEGPLYDLALNTEARQAAYASNTALKEIFLCE